VAPPSSSASARSRSSSGHQHQVDVWLPGQPAGSRLADPARGAGYERDVGHAVHDVNRLRRSRAALALFPGRYRCAVSHSFLALVTVAFVTGLIGYVTTGRAY